MAFNRGARLRAAGGEITALSGLLPQAAPLTLTAAELDALARLGGAEFESWALRGWWAGD